MGKLQFTVLYCSIIILLHCSNMCSPCDFLGCRVETDVLGGAETGREQAFHENNNLPEPCVTMLLEKLRKSDRSLDDCCLCLQHMFKDEPWLLRVSGETRWAARNSQAYRSNVPSVNCAHISTDTQAT